MVSWVAIDRFIEKMMASDELSREKVAERPFRSRAKKMSDEELTARLRSFGIDLDRSSLERLCRKHLSAEEMARPLIKKYTVESNKELHSDWIWVYLDGLWQRWFPEIPSFEMLDDKMQAGYELLAAGKIEATCHVWLDAWKDALRLCDKGGLRSLSEFDERFQGTQFLSNWIGDLEIELWNAGLDDRQFLTARIEVCEEGSGNLREMTT